MVTMALSCIISEIDILIETRDFFMPPAFVAPCICCPRYGGPSQSIAIRFVGIIQNGEKV